MPALWGGRNPWYSDVKVAFPPGTKAEDISVGYALGQWKTVGEVKIKNGKVLSRSGLPFLRDFNRAAQSNGQIIADRNVPNQVNDKAYRFAAFDTKGKPMSSTGPKRPRKNAD